MIRKVSAEDIAIRGNGTGMEYMCPTRHFVYIFFNPVFQVSTAKNEINLFNNHVLIVAPVTFAPAGAMTPSAEFLYVLLFVSPQFECARRASVLVLCKTLGNSLQKYFSFMSSPEQMLKVQGLPWKILERGRRPLSKIWKGHLAGGVGAT